MRIRAAPLRPSPQTASSRGFATFVFTEAAVTLQDLMGGGGLYTLWVGILVLWVLLFFVSPTAREGMLGGCRRMLGAPELTPSLKISSSVFRVGFARGREHYTGK